MNSPAVQPAFAPPITPVAAASRRAIRCAVSRETQARERGLEVRATEAKAHSLTYYMPGGRIREHTARSFVNLVVYARISPYATTPGAGMVRKASGRFYVAVGLSGRRPFFSGWCFESIETRMCCEI